MAHFSPYKKTSDATCIAQLLFFQEVISVYRLPKTIVSYYNNKFLSHFWRTLLKRLDITL